METESLEQAKPDELETLKGIPLFSNMDEQEIRGVLGIMEAKNFVPGQVIIYEGEPGELFHIITTGTVEYVTTDADDQEIVVDTASEGSYFGELSMLTGEPRTVRVRA